MQLHFSNNLAIALRNLSRNKMQSVFSIVGLAVAFFCFGFFAYFVHALLSPDEWSPNHDRIASLYASDSSHAGMILTDEEYQKVKDLPEVGEICSLAEVSTFSRLGEENMSFQSFQADTAFHCMFKPKLIAGSWNDALMSENSYAMCESWAIRFFGSAEAAIGQEFLNYPFTYTIRAVVEDLPSNNSISFMNRTGGYYFNDAAERSQGWPKYYVLAHEGYSREQLKTAINQLGIQLSSSLVKGQWLKAVNPTSIPFLNESVEGGKATIFLGYSFVSIIILLPGLLILLSALSNFFHLLLSNIMMRRREYVLRRAHGAHTWDLWLMVSTQVIVTMLLVGIASLIIVKFASPLLSFEVNRNSLVFDPDLMFMQDLKHIGILLLIGLVVAWLAVARIRKDSLQEAMKTSTGTRPSRHGLRNVLLCWQLIVGCLFITILAAVYMQLGYNRKSDLPQFTAKEKENILLFQQWSGENNEYSLASELQMMPDVETFSTGVNYSPYASGWKEFMVKAEGDTAMISNYRLKQQECEFLRIPLLSGRWAETESEVLADPDFLQAFGYELGSQITVSNHYISYTEEGKKEEHYDDKTYTITGVVDCRMQDLRNNYIGGMTNDPGIFSYHPNHDCYWVKCRPGKVEKVKEAIIQVAEAKGIRMNHNFMTLDKYIEQQYKGIGQFIPIFWLFSLIAIAISLLGIYSAITVDTTYRRKEMAIRKINGAKARHIAMRFARLYIILLGIAAAIVFPLVSILMDAVLVNTFHSTFSHGFGFFFCVFLIVAAFVALTIGAHVYRIAHINPAKIIKEE